MKTSIAHRNLRRLAACGLVALCAACSSDSPTEPTPSPGPPPGGGGGGATTFNVTVTARPTTIPAGSTEPVVITVRAVRADNGQPVGDGTPAILTAPTGGFGSAGGPSQIQITLTNGTGQAFYFPAADAPAGTVTIQANVGGSVGSAQLTVTEAATFFVSFVEPNVGAPAGGEEVFVHGSGFEEPVRVTFGSANARVLSVSPTRIRVRVPESPGAPNARVTVPVSVTINVNEPDQATDTLAGAYTYAPGASPEQPTVLSLTPATGPNEGGTRVVVTGSGFVAPVQVELCLAGTCLEAQVVSVSPNRLEIITPSATGFGQPLQNRTVDLRVRNLGSGFTAVFAAAFRYGTDVIITGLRGNEGPYFGGTTVIVEGQGFDAPVAIEYGGFGQSATSVTGTQIVSTSRGIITQSCEDRSGPVAVTNLETGDGDTGPVFTYLVVRFSPVIAGLTPTSGPQAGGTTVTIRGQHLRAPRVFFADRPAEVLTVAGDGSQLTVRSPFLPNERLRTESCDDNGDGTQGQRFLPTAVPVRVVNLDTTCDDAFPDAFVYTPTDSSCRNDVGPAPTAPQCNDGVDNDGDGDVDFPADAQCTDANDNNEAA